MKNKYFKYFLLISFFFLIIALIKIDYFVIPDTINAFYLIISIILLVIYHLIVAYSWKKLLNLYGYKINVYDGISSYGLSNLGKYIPGKIWNAVGEVTYIKNKYSYPIVETLKVSVICQIITLWTGLSLGLVSLYFLPITKIVALSVFLFWIILTFITFTKYFQSVYIYFINKIFKKELTINKIDLKKTFKMIPLFLLPWIILVFSYFLFAKSFNNNIDIYIGLCFILSVNIGVIIFLLPGGLGAREGVLISYFIATGFDLQYATNISIYSRLWFIIGEILIFLIAYLIDKRTRLLK